MAPILPVKSYTGHYACQGDAWFSVRDDGARQPLRPSVSRQVKRNRKALGHYLVDSDAAAPIYSVAVFGPRAHLDLNRPTVPVLQQSQLCDFILNLPPALTPLVAADLEPLFAPAPQPLFPALPLLRRGSAN